MLRRRQLLQRRRATATSPAPCPPAPCPPSPVPRSSAVPLSCPGAAGGAQAGVGGCRGNRERRRWSGLSGGRRRHALHSAGRRRRVRPSAEMVKVQSQQTRRRQHRFGPAGQGLFPVGRPDEVGPAQLQRVLPFAPHVRRPHEVRRPEQLKDVGLIDQRQRPLVPGAARMQAHHVAQVLVAERTGEAFELLDTSVSSCEYDAKIFRYGLAGSAAGGCAGHAAGAASQSTAMARLTSATMMAPR